GVCSGSLLQTLNHLCKTWPLGQVAQLGEQVIGKRHAFERGARLEPAMQGIGDIADLNHCHVGNMRPCDLNVKKRREPLSGRRLSFVYARETLPVIRIVRGTAMDLGMMMVFASYGWENTGDDQVWDEEIRLARLAADSGFDVLWSAEHHFFDYSFCPDNLQLMTYLAAACPGVGSARRRS